MCICAYIYTIDGRKRGGRGKGVGRKKTNVKNPYNKISQEEKKEDGILLN